MCHTIWLTRNLMTGDACNTYWNLIFFHTSITTQSVMRWSLQNHHIYAITNWCPYWESLKMKLFQDLSQWKSDRIKKTKPQENFILFSVDHDFIWQKKCHRNFFFWTIGPCQFNANILNDDFANLWRIWVLMNWICT